MAAAQDGDGTAYRQLLRDITPLLRRVTARRLHGAGAADVEDIVQEVLMAVHSARHTYDPARPFLPWLIAIQHNRMVDWVRRSIRRGKNELAVDSLEVTFADRAANTDDDGGADRQEIHAAVARLPAGQRRAIELLKLKQLSLREAAEKTGMSETALRVATHRGMKALRALLGRGE